MRFVYATLLAALYAAGVVTYALAWVLLGGAL